MIEESPPRTASLGRGIRIASVLVLAGLSFFPIGVWLNTTFQRALSFQAVGWWTGTALVGLLASVFVVVLRADHRAHTLGAPVHAAIALWERRPLACTTLIALTAGVLYCVSAWVVFDARPLLIDELVQVLQARAFAAGDLWFALDAHPEFRSIMHMVEQDGRWFGQFPPGGPGMLALGELVHAPWLVNPVCGAISVAAFGSLLRWSGVRSGVALGATVVFAFAPFVVFQSASHMNHVTSLMWLLIALAALVRATRTNSALAGLTCGLALGIAATIRPLDAATWAFPAAAWLAWCALRQNAWRAFLMSGVGVALPFAAMMWVNLQTTGGALTFGYTVLWGESHGLGFHTSPWGESHTVARGVALTAAYLNRLNEYLFELPIPSLLAPLGALAMLRRTTQLERYMLTSGALLIAAYFAYWHDGFYLGPRFMYPLAPIAALLVAQLPGLVGERIRLPIAARSVAAVYAAAIALGVWKVLPPRVQSYATGFQSMRWDYDAVAASAGAQGATILVRESWGAQVIRRLWALGVSRSLTEVLYRNVDTCGLDDAATRLEADGVRGAEAEARLRPMLADSARVVGTTFSPDLTERVLPNSSYPPVCFTRIAEDRGGYTHFEPAVLARDSTTRWIRDLHARDTLVVRLAEGRPVWLLRRDAADTAGTLKLVRIDGDSLRAAWYGNTAPTPAAVRR
ncbi:MAG TPA: hypothetical protein VJR92_14955 [Gemmatimonadaceae bacterium]|nr:hypothetical protein [Gemmatimonadaceae bacterium]